MSTLSLFPTTTARPPLTITPAVEALLADGAPVAIGVSGGKDSCAVAFAVCRHLDEIGHRGPRILVHSDLGRVEWADSAPTCKRLAAALGLELITVRRGAGDMMDRWQSRWESNMERYRNLECVKLILPWSTAAMRFCTSELKTAIICRDLVVRFPGQTILSVSGIRRQESSNRAKAPITKPQNKLTSAKYQTSGLDWQPILDWTLDDVWAELASNNFPAHEAYTTYGSSRVSCAFCILGSQADLAASVSCPDNAAIYREMVDLEIDSTFSFQSGKWLGDLAPDLLDWVQRGCIGRAKRMAMRREFAEAHIPPHLLYTSGWPTCMPTPQEARRLAKIRAYVSEAVGMVEVPFLDADSILARYAELLAGRAVVAPTARQARLEVV